MYTCMLRPFDSNYPCSGPQPPCLEPIFVVVLRVLAQVLRLGFRALLHAFLILLSASLFCPEHLVLDLLLTAKIFALNGLDILGCTVQDKVFISQGSR